MRFDGRRPELRVRILALPIFRIDRSVFAEWIEIVHAARTGQIASVEKQKPDITARDIGSNICSGQSAALADRLASQRGLHACSTWGSCRQDHDRGRERPPV